MIPRVILKCTILVELKLVYNIVFYSLGFRLETGWQITQRKKNILLLLDPITSNWDFFIFLLVKFACKIKVVFIGKHTIFVWPFNWILRKIGGIPVERTSTNNIVDQIVAEFNTRDNMIFALSPEGTRSYLNHWKSGFYHIARKANIPVQAAFFGC